MLQTPEETTEKENSLPPWPIAANPLVFACGHWSDHHCTSLKLCDHPRFQIHFRFLHLYFWLVLLPCGRWTRDGSLRQRHSRAGPRDQYIARTLPRRHGIVGQGRSYPCDGRRGDLAREAATRAKFVQDTEVESIRPIWTRWARPIRCGRCYLQRQT